MSGKVRVSQGFNCSPKDEVVFYPTDTNWTRIKADNHPMGARAMGAYRNLKANPDSLVSHIENCVATEQPFAVQLRELAALIPTRPTLQDWAKSLPEARREELNL